MGSPPQGYVANQLSVGTFAIQSTANGLGVLLSGTEQWTFNTDTGFTQRSVTGYISSRVNQIVIDARLGRYDGVATAAASEGVAPIFGIDNRSGLVAADGAPITLVTLAASPTGPLYRVGIDIFATAVTGGTATYTLTWTENAGSRTIAVSASVVNTLASALDLINPDPSTTMTVQLTFAAFTGTVKVAAVAELMGHT